MKRFLENSTYTKTKNFSYNGCSYFGNLVNLKPLKDICKERNIDIIEDAAKFWILL